MKREMEEQLAGGVGGNASQSPGGGGGGDGEGAPSRGGGGGRYRTSLRVVMKAKERCRRPPNQAEASSGRGKASKKFQRRRGGTGRSLGAQGHGKDPKNPLGCLCGGMYRNRQGLSSHLWYVRSGKASSQSKGTGSHGRQTKKSDQGQRPARASAAGAPGRSAGVGPSSSGAGLVGSESKLGWFSSTEPFEGGAGTKKVKEEVKDRALEHYRKEMEEERKKDAEGGGARPRRDIAGTSEWRVAGRKGRKVPFLVFRGGMGTGPWGRKKDPDSKSRNVGDDGDDAGPRGGGGTQAGGSKTKSDPGPRNIDFDNEEDLNYFFDKMKVVKEMPDDSDSDDEEDEGAAAAPVQLNPVVRLPPAPPNPIQPVNVNTGRGRRVKSIPRKLTVVVEPEDPDVVYENVTPPPVSRQSSPPPTGPESTSASGLEDAVAERAKEDIERIEKFGNPKTDCHLS